MSVLLFGYVIADNLRESRDGSDSDRFGLDSKILRLGVQTTFSIRAVRLC